MAEDQVTRIDYLSCQLPLNQVIDSRRGVRRSSVLFTMTLLSLFCLIDVQLYVFFSDG